MSETLIKVEGVSKKFCRSLKRSLWYGMKDLGCELFGRRHGRVEGLRPDEFWAVKDISFELKRGECLGLIGPNGAGKSTLLKMLNGLIKPDKGRITMKGRVGALIELGTGFNPVLTGRENIYVNGAVLGFTKEEIDRKFDDIVGFSELGEFIDTPVQNYSSGMKVRLGFAVAAQMEPDILIIDEVLAVGDAGFRAKCFDQIAKVSKKASLLLVSHSMAEISRVASDVLLMKNGHVLFKGRDVAFGTAEYFRQFIYSSKKISGGRETCRIHKVALKSNGKTSKDGKLKINYGDPLEIEISYSLDEKIKNCLINIGFLNDERRTIGQCSSIKENYYANNSCGICKSNVMIDRIPFTLGKYELSLYFVEDLGNNRRGEVILFELAAASFEVFDKTPGFSPVELRADWK